ncbi:uncharacterized protein SETTUDRAFT_183049 [Exserohilum turcica Et28A]|uniref:Uncharacterized protein n=1 Tax=Exserohilum turcicum (strain 28A) TaxID=671987 RepID=R0KKN2_EXST2|nr:uncharacterized protein SETTUDRAFT_183049 [Exserohilum turcica Et28A]EOA89674.1 hypothetical protein SETTUDRAFT_183049 [Exserohilum turcica Et28A]
MMEIASRQLAPHHQPITAASSKLSFKDTTWTFPKKLKKKRRRPSDLFNINFGFGFSSRRRQSSDDSPHVSPRTSISSPSASPRADLMESFKRQRIDSTGSDMHQPEDPHPGQLVDFSLSPASLALHAPPTPAPVPAPPTMLPLPELSTDFNTRPTTDAYDDYLAATTTTTHRRNSFPAVDWDNAAATTKELLEIDPKDTTTITTTTVAPLPAQPLEASKCELRRTTSDPSTERFLTHIRASLEARRSKSGRTWQTYPVFADEVEKGFLDDAPL